MNTLSYGNNSLSASAPSAGLWRRAANLYWTGWTQYAASLNPDAGFRLQAPAFSRNVARFAEPAANGERLIDRAA